MQKHFKHSILALFTVTILSSCVPIVATSVGGAAMTISKDRTSESMLTDLKIANSIRASFIKNDFNNLYTKINVEVFNSRVMLTGYLDDSADKMRALEIVRGNADIAEIIDELKVIDKKIVFNASQYAKDSLITSQIKSKLFIEKEIKGRNYIIVTYQDVVYMLGVAQCEEELEKVANIAANVNGVEKVVSHVTIISESGINNYSNKANIADEDNISVKEINTEWSKY